MTTHYGAPQVSEREYRRMLLNLIVPSHLEATDPAKDWNTERLEEAVIGLGMDLPIVRRDFDAAKSTETLDIQATD